MNTRSRLCLFLFGCLVPWIGKAEVKQHLELELRSEDYAALLEQIVVDDRVELKPVLDTGKRFLDWIKFINASRPAAQAISLYSPETQNAYPIETPGFNSPTLVLQKYKDLKTQLPDWFKKVLFENGAFVSNLPVNDVEFATLGRLVDRAYQSAARWTLQEPYLFQYAARKREDIRGFYHLGKYRNPFASWNEQTATEKASKVEWLKGMCINSASESSCNSQVNAAKTDGTKLNQLYTQYLPSARRTYDGYFKLANARSDIRWTDAKASIPFIRPDSQAVESFLKVNIEDEWRWQNWGLKLDFVADGFGTTHIEFEAGATPHVNGLGGSTITMDANAPLSDYGVQWTIRHEFGHVLGFPDCYVEFYDESSKTMVNYQIDITNLMCSRKGKLQEKHYVAMKEAYSR